LCDQQLYLRFAGPCDILQQFTHYQSGKPDCRFLINVVSLRLLSFAEYRLRLSNHMCAAAFKAIIGLNGLPKCLLTSVTIVQRHIHTIMFRPSCSNSTLFSTKKTSINIHEEGTRRSLAAKQSPCNSWAGTGVAIAAALSGVMHVQPSKETSTQP
jgi:hypothetical protein